VMYCERKVREIDMIRKAELKDIHTIIEVVFDTVKIMKEEGNDQWDDSYPQKENFVEDLDNNSLYVYEHNQEVVGSITIDQNQPIEYKPLNWSKNEPAYVFHRLVVKLDVRHLGIASQLIDFAEKQALLNDVKYMRIDTYSLNEKAVQLFNKKGYIKIGEMAFHGKEFPFYCFDKELIDCRSNEKRVKKKIFK
jgi:ribosomal protein S18 acetylase RimI-like enzyme